MALRSKAAPWVTFGNGLYRRGNTFFIRVRIPRDLRDTYRDGVPQSEICEALKTSERREAERRCRQRRAEIDREFTQKRRARSRADGPNSRDLDRAAQQLYRSEVAERSAALHDDIMRDPDGVELGLDHELDYWAESLEEDRWSRRQNEMVGALLAAAGSPISSDHPLFPEARDKMARAFVHTTRNLVARTRGEDYRPPDPLFAAAPPAPAALGGGITLGELIARYQADKGAGWSGKTRDGYILIFRALNEALGEQTPVASVDRDDCRRVRQILTDLAPNYTKLPATRGRAMEEAATISRELGLPRRKPESVNSYLNNLAALMNYAENEGLIAKSPAKGLMLPVSTKKKDRRDPFATEQLRRIFGPASPMYASGAGLEDRGGRFWVPLLSLWSGMRLNECCQLHVDDVRYVRDVPIIVITEGAEGDDTKRVKTEAGERWVPVHPELERLGFLRHWEVAKSAGLPRLFPDLRPGANGYFSDPFSKWFSRYLRHQAVAAYTPKTTFHSFRHNYRDALRDTEISAEMVRALGGWASTGTSDDYGSGFTPERLFAAIKAVRYDGLDLSHLYCDG
jgi:integrase